MSRNDMENQNDRYYKLAEKYLDGSISPDEEKDFTEWYNTLEHKDTIHIPASFAKSEAALENRIRRKMQKAAGERNHSRQPFYAAAAMILLIAGAGAYFFFKPATGDAVAIKTPATQKQAINPGSDKAILTLADGSQILLDEVTDGALTQQGVTKVIKLKSGQIAYQASGKDTLAAAPSFNTITTPRGGQYQIVLPDGSKVWLNASSSLRFPTAFAAGERVVQLTGEGYFDIAQNQASAFRVLVNEMQIAVLGTQFNVMAYQDDREIATTLVEGSVKVIAGNAASLLKPGEQASLPRSASQFKISGEINVKQVIAWKNGEFYFENTDIRSVMSQISRWYDVQIVYNGHLQGIGFSGIIPRMKDLAQVLEILEATRLVRFQRDGNKIIVSRLRPE